MILLVEDNEDDADLTLRAFRNSGLDCKIVLVRDGRQALDYVFGDADRDRNVPLGLILLDLKLPCVSGLDVLRALRDSPKGQQIPVVFGELGNHGAPDHAGGVAAECRMEHRRRQRHA